MNEKECIVKATHLSCHAATQQHLALTTRTACAALLAPLVLAGCGDRAVRHLQHDGGGKLVVRLSAAFSGLEDVDRVPGARGLVW